MTEILDLFGEPVPPNWGQRGRPQHIPSQQNRNRVSMLVALGWSNKRIARSMFITLPTLRKHYFSELKFREVARDRLETGLAMKLWEQFQAGNVAAGKEFRKLLERNDVMAGHASFYGEQRKAVEAESASPDKLGKKEQAALDAETAGQNTEWGGDLMPPRH